MAEIPTDDEISSFVGNARIFRKQSARIAELEGALATAREDALWEAADRCEKTERIIGELLAMIDDALAPPAGHISMHAQGQSPEWFVEAAFESCYLRKDILTLINKEPKP